MKPIITFARLFALALLLLWSWHQAAAQSKIAEANNWFNLGVQEKEAAKKIAAYQKALERDPTFVEAFYNLGVLYKQQNDHQNAEQYLSKALAARPDRLKAELKLQILYELAAAQKKLGKAKEAEQNFREAKALATAPEMRAVAALNLGRLLVEQGRYGEAIAELKAAQNLSSESSKRRNEIQNLLEFAENEIELQRLYAAAEKAKAGGNLKEVKTLLAQIKAKKPEDKTLDAMIAAVEASQQAESQKVASAVLYQQAQQHAAAGNWELAIASYEALLEQEGNYKDARTGLEAARQQLAQQQRNEQLESEYAAGLAALKFRDWTRAQLAFEKVLELDRNFRDARKRLAEAQSGLERESTETILARYYADGVAAMNRNDLGGALVAFEKVRRINPNYRDSARLLAETENALRMKTAPTFHDKSLDEKSALTEAQRDSLYQQALAAFEREDWMPAVVALEKVQLLAPNYRDVVDRLAQAKANLSLAGSEALAEGSGFPALGAAIAALIVLSLLGFVALSPCSRARFQLMRGNYAEAARLYEKFLQRHPQRIKAYSCLANLYLLLGRKDKHALQVFKTVLQFNLANRNREQINSIVAQNFLTEGRTDTEAIEVLEDALKVEQRRQKGR